jgi:hypothetical protein
MATSTETHALEAAALRAVALRLLAAGQVDEGCAALARIASAYPDTPEAAPAAEQRRLEALADPNGACAAVPASSAPDNRGQIELIVSQGIVAPIVLGGLVPILFDANAPAPFVLGSFAGLAAGIGGTYAVTRSHPVSTGQAMAVYQGEAIGAWNAGALVLIGSPD